MPFQVESDLKVEGRRLKVGGFSLLEVVISFAILGLILVIITAGFNRFSQSQALTATAADVVSVLDTARSKTLASEGNSAFGVHFATSSVTLFQGNTYATGTATNVVTTFDRKITLSSSLTAGRGDVVFRRLTGETDTVGIITLSVIGGSASTTISISQTGLVGQ